MMMHKKKWAMISLQIIITLFFLYLTFHNTHFDELTSSFRTVNYGMLSLTLLPQFISLFLLAAREKHLLKKIFSFQFRDLIKGVVISIIGNNILPLRGGEFLKVLFWKKQSAHAYVSLLSVAMIERLLDLICLITLFFVGSQVVLLQLGVKIKWVLLIFFVMMLPIAIIIFLDWKCNKQFKLPASLERMFGESITKKCNGFLNKIMLGFRVLGDIKNIFYALCYTIAYWIMNLLGLFIMLYAFHLNVSWRETVVVLLATSLGVAIPAAPGNIGTYDYFAKMGLVFYGVNASVATSFAIVSHLISIVPFTILGILFVYPALSRLMRTSEGAATC